jgi:hypothetical protein
MNPIRKIGKYEFPLLSVAATAERDDGNYDVILHGGITIILTKDEKAELDAERDIYNKTMEVLGMAASAGLRATSL